MKSGRCAVFLLSVVLLPWVIPGLRSAPVLGGGAPCQDPEGATAQLAIRVTNWQPPVGDPSIPRTAGWCTAYWSLPSLRTAYPDHITATTSVRVPIDPRGDCLLEVPAGKAILVFVEETESFRRTRLLQPPLAPNEIRQVALRALSRRLLLSGIALDEDETPVGGISIQGCRRFPSYELWKASLPYWRVDELPAPPSRRTASTLSSDDGSWRLELDLSDRYVPGSSDIVVLTAASESKVGASALAIDLRLAGEEVDSLIMQVFPRSALEGTVAWKDGTPAFGVSVRVRPVISNQALLYPPVTRMVANPTMARAETDRLGAFILEDLPTVPLILEVDDGVTPGFHALVIVPGQEPLQLRATR